MIQAFGLTSNPRKAHPPAVDDVSFEARAGRVTALLGSKGAGKTTVLRLMLELQQGRGITYFRGRPLHRIAHPAREVGVLLGDVPGHPSRSVRGHLRMLCAAAGVPARRADEVLEVLGLVSLREERLGTLSRGMDRRLGLACALLPDPHTLVLDEPARGLSRREARWLHGMLRAHATQGGTVLFSTADPKEAARAADHVVTLDGGRIAADQEVRRFARTRLRPRVAVRSPHAARLATLLTKEARAAHRSVEVVRENGNRLSVYGTTTADIGETAFRHGILIHQLADEVGDMGPDAGADPHDERDAGTEPSPSGPDQCAAAAASGAGSQAEPVLPWIGRTPSELSLSRTEPSQAEPSPSRRDQVPAVQGSGPSDNGSAAPGSSVAWRGAPQTPAAPGSSPLERDPEAVPGGMPTEREEAAVSAVAAGEHEQAGVGLLSMKDPQGSDGGPRRPGEAVGHHHGADPVETADQVSHDGPAPAVVTSGTGTATCEVADPAAGVGAGVGDRVPAEALARADGPRPVGAAAGPDAGRATNSVMPEAYADTTSSSAAGVPTTRAHLPGARNPGSRRPQPERSARPDAVRTLDALPSLPPPISVRTAPGPLRPLRYELRRATGIGTGFLTCGAVLVVSALTAVLLARLGHTPQARLFAAWPRELPLPPTALAAGLLGALAFGDEFRHPALAADRGTVPRRLGLLTAKLLVSGATAVMLAFLTVGCDAEMLYLVYGRELTQVPGDWLSLTASWFGLVVGCAWAGVLAAGVFRSTTAGLAAVLAVPVLVVPLVQALPGPAVRMAAGLPARMREVFLLQWPFGGERYLLGVARIVAQPLGGALALSLTALLCAYLLTTLRTRVR
ncbi:ATP-binding cassette domain-containing protein [Streptomyces sp. NK08204]|uniref:ATP-binding cassette domain-containing protein n=1 Tax=Streptomyces sp. NK08204 TaxID=2873260 RepID=UPI001CEDC5FF|nr:ATP-binding cassette domain-containing protein [Streptomyces sp. NK08204]